MDNIEKNFKGRLGVIDCSLADDPETFREVALEELLSFEDCSLTCNSEDNVWQYYYVKTGKTMDDGLFVKIKYDVVVHSLDEKDR